jgi:hypothetical protein
MRCVYFLRRDRRTSNPPESSTTADAAEAPSISGVAIAPANTELAEPINIKPKPIIFDKIFSSD